MSGEAEEAAVGRPPAGDAAGYRVYGDRWVVLGVFMIVNVIIQVLWIGYAPIIAESADY